MNLNKKLKNLKIFYLLNKNQIKPNKKKHNSLILNIKLKKKLNQNLKLN